MMVFSTALIQRKYCAENLFRTLSWTLMCVFVNHFHWPIWQLPDVSLSLHTSYCYEENSDEGKRSISKGKKHALMSTRWQLFSGNDLDREVRNIRNTAPAGIYLADQDAAFLIQSFNLTDDWPRYGRMFRSVGVRSSKLPGIYLIPLFCGNHRNGHWTLIMIWRNGRRNRGYNFDSMGKSITTGIIFEKIKRAFTGKRDRFSWIPAQCLPQ